MTMNSVRRTRYDLLRGVHRRFYVSALEPAPAVHSLLTLLYSVHMHARYMLHADANSSAESQEGTGSRDTTVDSRIVAAAEGGGPTARQHGNRVLTFATLCGMFGDAPTDGSCALLCQLLAVLLPRRSMQSRLALPDACIGVDAPSARFLAEAAQAGSSTASAPRLGVDERSRDTSAKRADSAELALRSDVDDAHDLAGGTKRDRALLDALHLLGLSDAQLAAQRRHIDSCEEVSEEVSLRTLADEEQQIAHERSPLSHVLSRSTVADAVQTFAGGTAARHALGSGSCADSGGGNSSGKVQVRKVPIDVAVGLLLCSHRNALAARARVYAARFAEATRRTHGRVLDVKQFVGLVLSVDEDVSMAKALDMCDALSALCFTPLGVYQYAPTHADAFCYYASKFALAHARACFH